MQTEMMGDQFISSEVKGLKSRLLLILVFQFGEDRTFKQISGLLL